MKTLPTTLPQLTSSWANDLAWLANPVHDLAVDLTPYQPYRPGPGHTYDLPALWAWLRQVDQLPTSPIPQPNRLGLYFENLVAYWLNHCPLHRDRLLYRNQQIVGPNPDGRTRGELDFLIETNGVPRHLEVAVKFYLQEDTQRARWSGPNSRDYLKRKLHHLREHQLPMGQYYCGPDKPESSVYWLKGILFYPWSTQQGTPERYRWIREAQLNDYLSDENTGWSLVDKKRWLGATPALHLSAQALRAEVAARLENTNGVMLLENISPPENARRTMVVRDEWPQ